MLTRRMASMVLTGPRVRGRTKAKKTETVPRVENGSSLTSHVLSDTSCGVRTEYARLMVQTSTSRDFSRTLSTSLSSGSALNMMTEMISYGWYASHLVFAGFSFSLVWLVMLLWNESALAALQLREPDGPVIWEWTDPLEYRQG